MSEKMIFLDRDGTLNPDPITTRYVNEASQFTLIPGVVEALHKLKEAGYLFCIVSNQGGVGKGFMTQETLDEIDARMREMLEAGGIQLSGSFYCTDKPEEATHHRKPNPGMLEDAAKDKELDKQLSYIIGDSDRDIEAGRRFGCGTVLVLSGKTKEHHVNSFKGKPDFVAVDMKEAVEWILKQKKS